MNTLHQRLFASWFTIAVSVAASSQAQEIQHATHVAPVPLPKLNDAPSVQFSQKPAQVGDRVAQQISTELQLRSSVVQAKQVVQQDDSTLKRRQHRLVEVLEVEAGRVLRARVSFPLSRGQSPENKDPEQEVVQPVEGKTYLLARQGEKLLVTDAEGSIPPRDEFEIVLTSMQSLGLPNPLAKFLLGRTIFVGERLQLPKQIAEQMLGFGKDLGDVSKFQLELKELKSFQGAPCAVFAATVEVGGGSGGPMRMEVAGPVVILTDSCRTALVDLSGPLSMSAQQRTALGSYQYQAQGSMRVAVRSNYGPAAKGRETRVENQTLGQIFSGSRP